MSHNNDYSYIDMILSESSEENSVEMIPLLSMEEEAEDLNSEDIIIDDLPILPVKNTVLFPGVVIPVTVGRQKSIKLVKKAYNSDKTIGVIAQDNSDIEDPTTDDLYQVGTIAHILKMLVLPDGNTTIILQGKKRFNVLNFTEDEPFIKARIETISESFPTKDDRETTALISSLKEAASKILKLNPEIPQEAQIALDNIESASFLTHFLSSNINADTLEKQRLLETNDGLKRATMLLEFMHKDIQLLELKREIQSKVHSDIDQQQRDYFLRQQMKVLQDELGSETGDQELDGLKMRAKKKKWPAEVAKQFEKEIVKISRMNPASAEYPIAVNYAELLVDLPWNDITRDSLDLSKAQKILDSDHHGLEKVKERIIEYLAVLKLKNNMRGPILCFYGPPGVGKTSLGKSIAKSLNRKYIRMALGGLHDEAEIRGHRKTYIGAMPGKIIQNIKKAGSSNPVIILDEIDKVSSDFRGDPASALLEVLDPEQNNTFSDNYLELAYDLSKVLFIATANSLDTIHPALRDRMEIIEITGYTEEEKVQIAKKHLIPKQRKEHGLSAKEVKFQPLAINKIIENYTRESGVRNLERQVGKVIRKVAKSVAMEEKYSKTIQPKDITRLLGIELFDKEEYQTEDVSGVVTGLAWTQVGGEILYIESILSRGKGKLTLSGQLGDVMKESASAALSYLKATASHLDIDHRVFEHFDLHVHIPAGAVPKDGPSAGIAMFTSLASVYTQRKVKEKLAMTGEITLRGRVLPVGGIKEKILAAKRAGIKEVILCEKNRKDIDEIQSNYIEDLTFHFVNHVDQVLDIALLPEKVKRQFDLSIKEENESK
ncbi:endopeptidase La [uncultured Microscilla sp.]|uniref:endopeptidase La n=1 Tax=uncultured Microscilla sp. TaxID=432653 RepID=UPI00260D5C33|nr:endopeptidase La [uncultured Microscilla sp.]